MRGSFNAVYETSVFAGRDLADFYYFSYMELEDMIN